MGFILNTKNNIYFLAFNKEKIDIQNIYDLELTTRDSLGKTRIFKQRFYSYKGTRFPLVLGLP